MSKMREYMEYLKNDKSYGWIANHGWELSKDELINIIKELTFAIYISSEANEIYTETLLNLNELYGEEDDYE